MLRRLAATAVAVLAPVLLPVLTGGSAAAADPPAPPLFQQGPRLVPSDTTGVLSFGDSVALSADGQTVLVGANADAQHTISAWVFVRVGNQWVEQQRLTPSDGAGPTPYGAKVALSGDGNTALVTWSKDTSGAAAWIFTRSGGSWSQRAKLLPDDPSLLSLDGQFGTSAALSTDGHTALVGGYGDDNGYGAGWVFVRSGDRWTQQGAKLTAHGPSNGDYLLFGMSAALSADGDVALLGGYGGGLGAAWAFARANGHWSHQGAKLTANDEAGEGLLGYTVALDGDGDTALVGGFGDDDYRGAAWSFTRTGTTWAQSAPKLAPPDGVAAQLGVALALSADGQTALVGGPGGLSGEGSSWLFRRTSDSWSPTGSKLTVTDPDPSYGTQLGSSAALSADGTIALVSGFGSPFGSAWVFGLTPVAVPELTVDDYTDQPLGDTWTFATLSAGDAPTGTLEYRLYGPDDDCSAEPVITATESVSGNSRYVTQQLRFDAAGLYQLVVSYSGDERNVAVTTFCGQHPVRVKASPSLQAGLDGPPTLDRPLGFAIALHDAATPTGHVTLQVHDPSDPTCEKAPVFTRTVELVAGVLPAIAYVPNAIGRLYYTVSYDGDVRNFASELTVCAGDAPALSIGRAEPVLSTAPTAAVTVGDAIGASARTAGGAEPTGAVTFSLYPPSDPACERRPIAAATQPLVGGSAVSGAFATTATGTYRFTADYGGDQRNRGASAPCSTAVDVGRRRPTLAVAASVSDTADGDGTVSGVAALHDAFRPSGNVGFTLFGPDDLGCRRRAAFAVLTPLDGARATMIPLDGVAAGRYELVAGYDGDADNAAVASVCGAASLIVPGASLRRALSARAGVHVEVACFGATRPCRGEVAITASALGRRVVVGRLRYTIHPGATVTRRVALGRTGRRLLRARKRLPVTVALGGPAGASTRDTPMRVTLRAARG